MLTFYANGGTADSQSTQLSTFTGGQCSSLETKDFSEVYDAALNSVRWSAASGPAFCFPSSNDRGGADACTFMSGSQLQTAGGTGLSLTLSQKACYSPSGWYCNGRRCSGGKETCRDIDWFWCGCTQARRTRDQSCLSASLTRCTDILHRRLEHQVLLVVWPVHSQLCPKQPANRQRHLLRLRFVRKVGRRLREHQDVHAVRRE